MTTKLAAGIERHLTIEELADRVGVSTKTVYTWNSRGGGPRYLRVGRHVRYKLADVIAWENSLYADGGDAA